MPSDTPQQATEKPHALKRGDLRGPAAHTYIPARCSARHYADTFSRALFLARKLPHYGDQLAHDLFGEVAALLPEDIDLLATSPRGRYSSTKGWYVAHELAVAISTICGVWQKSRTVYICAATMGFGTAS